MTNTTLDYIGKRFGVNTSSPIVRLTQINRTILADVFNELGFTHGAEIGVAEGYYSKVLCDTIPGLTLYCVDCYATYPGYEEYANPEALYLDAQHRLKPYNCIFIKKMSMDAVADVADNSLDFVFIDGAHDFKNVACDICEWSKKVRVGGIVFGHDYKYHLAYYQKSSRHSPRLRHKVEVKIVVDAYRDARKIRPWFEVFPEIKDPTFGLDNPCWMFVRQEGDHV